KEKVSQLRRAHDECLRFLVEDKVPTERILQFLEEMAVEVVMELYETVVGLQRVTSVLEMITESTPLRCRKLSNPDIFSSAGKTKLHRQLSQDDCKLRRGSLASSLSGKQLLPLSNSVHSGVGQTLWQPPGDTSNLVRMRNQSLGQSAPSLTAG
ncbi:hypothetical protein EK904_011530, partial [Melospiza melodia maxima]